MSTAVRNPISLRFPFELKDQPPDVVQAHRYSFQGIVDLQQAIAALKSQITALQTSTTSTGTSTSTTTNTITIESILSGLGMVNDQTGQTSYTVQTQDAGALLILNDASPVAVTLNSVVSTPYALFITNFGAGTATLTPTSGTVNGSASYSLLQYQTVWVVFDGTNWETSAVTPTGTQPYRAISSATTITSADYQIEVTAGTFIQPLPTAVGIQGKSYSIKNSGTGIVTVSTTGGQTIDGSATQPLTQYDNLQVMSNGTNWIVT